MKPNRTLVLAPVAIVLVILGLSFAPTSPSTPVSIAEVVGPPAIATVLVVVTPDYTPTPTALPTATSTPVPTRTPVPTATRDPNLRTIQVPILMYHYLSVPPPDADKYRLDLSVTPANFELQMEYLAIEGYHPIRLSDLAEYLQTGKPLPPKPIVLTFDDGYADNYTNAFPILQNYKFPATFFVITQFIEENRPGYMTWKQLGEMASAGMEIGSHSMNHLDLYNKLRTVLTTQIAGSKVQIESRLNVPVKSFSYPAGRYNSRTIDVVRSSGYLAAVTELTGSQQSSKTPYELRRIRVRGSYSTNDFAYWLKYYLSNGR